MSPDWSLMECRFCERWIRRERTRGLLICEVCAKDPAFRERARIAMWLLRHAAPEYATPAEAAGAIIEGRHFEGYEDEAELWSASEVITHDAEGRRSDGRAPVPFDLDALMRSSVPWRR